LEWSRSQTGRIELKPENIDLYKLVEENVNLLIGIAENKGIELVNIVKSNTTAFADQNMINTVIRNLVNNALKYTSKGGRVTISSNITDGEAELIVSDTGVGIMDENIGKLFRIDVNYSTPGTDEESGTGLGLILCKEFVEKNKGRIEIKSTFGKGSDFSIRLPLNA